MNICHTCGIGEIYISAYCHASLCTICNLGHDNWYEALRNEIALYFLFSFCYMNSFLYYILFDYLWNLMRW